MLLIQGSNNVVGPIQFNHYPAFQILSAFVK